MTASIINNDSNCGETSSLLGNSSDPASMGNNNNGASSSSSAAAAPQHQSLSTSASQQQQQQQIIITGDATVLQTCTNMAKTCMGTGCLVLPFAARQGGWLLHTFGLLVIAAWNIYTVQRLCLCLEYLPLQQQQQQQQPSMIQPIQRRSNNNNNHKKGRLSTIVSGEELDLCETGHKSDVLNNGTGNHQPAQRAESNKTALHSYHLHHPPEETAMFGKVVWYAVGPYGLMALDILMVSFLIGILVTYMNAMRSFLRDTPLTTNSDVVDALILVFIMGPLSCVPHMGYLARASAMGLLVLAATFVVLGVYGLEEYNSLKQPHHSAEIVSSVLPEHGLWGISHWFGCVVFSFGVAPLTYNFRSSMADPTQMVPATGYALMGVALAYMGLGIGFWMLFPDLEGDLLQELPLTGFLPVITRLAMVVVVLTTAPLLIVPCGELMESKISYAATQSMILFTSSRNRNQYHERLNDDHDHHQFRRILFRFGICFLGVGISIYVPGFVDVLSFVGCCCVACLGFCIPPLLHALLCFQARQYRPWNGWTMLVDVLMLSWGIFATVVSTAYTFRQISVGGA